MIDPLPSIAEIKGGVRYIDPDNPPPDLLANSESNNQKPQGESFNETAESILNSKFSAQDQKEETCAALGAEIKIGNALVPPPTTAALMLLDVIESPFIVQTPKEYEVTLKDVYETLFVLCLREKAVQSIFSAVRALRAIEKTAQFAKINELFYEKYLTALIAVQGGYENFDSEVAQFAESCGIFSLPEAIKNLNFYISLCFGGFEMIPGKTADGKKNDLIPNGSPK